MLPTSSQEKMRKGGHWHLCSCQVAYGNIKQGNRVEFFDKHSIAYMTACICHIDPSSGIKEASCMRMPKRMGIIYLMPFNSRQSFMSGFGKGSIEEPRNATTQKKGNTLPQTPDSTTIDHRYEIHSLNSNSTAWSREDNKNGRDSSDGYATLAITRIKT